MKVYKVDWTKIKTAEDVMDVLRLLDVTLTEKALEANPHMEDKVIEVEAKDG